MAKKKKESWISAEASRDGETMFAIDLNVPMDEHWEERRRWIDAIELADAASFDPGPEGELADKGNALPLIVMLASQLPMPPGTHRFVVDLLDRHPGLKKITPGRPKRGERQRARELIAKVRSVDAIDRPEREALARVLLEYRLVRGYGRQRTPLYDPMTAAEAALVSAKAEVEAYRRLNRLSINDSYFITQAVAKLHGIEPEALANFMTGNRGSSTRLRRRLVPPK